ncbi:Oxidoreductase [Coemansia erecta]|nr:Oxidoreductase [Coemansia sp. RSA 2618]KAJ2823555.1 Oxidoreductase [Coemansia erecta]
MSSEKDTSSRADEQRVDEPEISSSIDTAELSTGSEQPENEQAQAFNPETGEINWDCPCLGGMAHGTCGEEFKAAFSCFVYSEEEPKGIDCVSVFKAMQECFREHPEEYAAELDDGEEDEKEETDIEDDRETDVEDDRETDIEDGTAADQTSSKESQD